MSSSAASPRVVNIGEVIVNGIIFDPKNSEALRTMDLQDVLRRIPRLFDLLDERGVPYVLAGGIAMLVYVEGRNTQDIDLVVPTDALDTVPELVVDERRDEFARTMYGDLRVDLLFTDHGLFDTVHRDYSTVRRFAERDIRCATVEGLTMMKLYALPSLYRQGRFGRLHIQEGDVGSLLSVFRTDLKSIFGELENHLTATDVDGLREIVDDIQKQLATQRTRFNRSAGYDHSCKVAPSHS